MKVTILNESKEELSHSQKLFNQLTQAFSNQKQEIQLVVSNLLSQLVFLEKNIIEMSKRINPNTLISKDKPTAEFQAYLSMLKTYTDIIERLIKTLENN